MTKKQREKRYKELKKEYRQLASTADKRLRTLENAVESGRVKDATKYAYQRALRDINSYTKVEKGKPAKFNTAPPKSIAGLKRKLADINRFLDSETSTVGGIHNAYDKRAEKLSDMYGFKFDRETMRMFDNENLREIMYGDKGLGSDTVIKVIGKMRKKKKAVEQYIEGMKNRNQSLGGFLKGEAKGTVQRKVMERLLENDDVMADILKGATGETEE